MWGWGGGVDVWGVGWWMCGGWGGGCGGQACYQLAQAGLGWLCCFLEHSLRETAEDPEVNIEGGKE